jgi:hypothetical protein
MRKDRFLRTAATAWWISAVAAVAALGQVNVTLIVRQPAPPQLSVWEHDQTVVQMIITNATATSYPDAHVSFTIRDMGKDQIVAHSLDDNPAEPRFTLASGATVVRFAPDLVTRQALYIDPVLNASLITTNSFPEGDYEFCVALLSGNGDTVTTTGILCKQFTITIPDPPSLVLPADGDSLSSMTPPVFSWTPVNQLGVIPKYRLVIAPRFNSQSAADAITINLPLVSKEVTTSSYVYLPSDPLFGSSVGAVGFAWQVTALDNSGNPLGRNEGKSEVFSFFFKTADTTHDTSSADTAHASSDTAGSGCVANCDAPSPHSTVAVSRNFGVNDTLTIGLFKLKVTSLTSATGLALGGEGTVKVPFLHAPIMVTFNGVKVNAQNEIFDGTVSAKTDPGSPVADAVANASGSLGMSESDIQAVSNYARQPAKLVSALAGTVPVGLPLGLDNYIDGVNMTVAVMGMQFTPHHATLNAVAQFPLPDLGPNVGIGVGARDICFHPDGLGTGAGSLFLSQDIGYARPGSFGFVFKGATGGDSGTYLHWDCRGFQYLHLKAQAIFPRDWLLPSPDNGDTVRAAFAADIRKSGDFLASASLPACEIAGSNGMKLGAASMTYDHSDVSNPPGIRFPDGYPSSATGPDWHGFYIGGISVSLPKDLATFDSSTPPSIALTGVIIDDQGFSATITGRNIIHYPQGNFGEWGASVDSIGVQFVKSSLTHGQIDGRIKMPISDSALAYQALLNQVPDSGVAFSFTIRPVSDIPATIWAATLTVDHTSQISLAKRPGGNFKAQAVLNGKISISGNVGGVNNMNFDLMDFNGLTVQTDTPYVSVGHWSFASPDHGVMGFPVSITNIGLASGPRSGGFGVGLAMNFAVNLSDDLSGNAGLTVWGKMNLGGGPMQFSFDGVDLDSIGLHADLGAVDITGRISFYRNDATYGDGFRGAIDAKFLHSVEIQSTAQFGSVHGYRYWYVDAAAMFPSPGIIISTGLAWYGFGGGAWYHMRRSVTEVPPPTADQMAAASPGATASGYTFTPDQSIELGLHAAITLASTPENSAFNGDVALDMQFVSTGIGEMTLSGHAWMMTSPSERRNTITAGVTIDYNFTTSTFHGVFNYTVDVSPIISSHGQMVAHADPAVWYFTVGTPDEPITAEILSLVEVKAYFMTGSSIPAPPGLPDTIKAHFPTFDAARSPLIGSGAGFAFGVSAGFHTGRQTFLIFYGQVDAAVGFDISLIDVGTQHICDNVDGPVGMNGWYASGDMWTYLSASIGLHVDVWFTSGDFEILGLSMAAVIEGGAPNPTWVKGGIDGHYDILDGLVSGSCHFEFTIGNVCIPDAGTPFDKIDIISSVQPASGSGVDVFVQPQAAFNFSIGKNIEVTELSGDGSQSMIRTFRVMLTDFSMAQGSAPVPATYGVASDGTQATLTPQQCLAPRAPHTIHVTATGQELKNGVWVQATRPDGSPTRQEVTVTFTTGDRPDSIAGRNVMYSYPFNRQRFFLANENHDGRVALRIGQQYLFEPKSGYTTTFVARFVPLIGGGAEVESPLGFDGPNITFSVPPLEKEKIYALQIVRQERVDQHYAILHGASLAPPAAADAVSAQIRTKNLTFTNAALTAAVHVNVRQRQLPGVQVRSGEKLLYVYYFRTSKYGTLLEKISSLGQLGVTDRRADAGRLVQVNYNSGEGWDAWDVRDYSFDAGRGATAIQHALVKVAAYWMESPWHKKFVAPWIYDAVTRLQNKGVWDGSQTSLTRAVFNLDMPLAQLDVPVQQPLQDYELAPRLPWMSAAALHSLGIPAASGGIAAVSTGSSSSVMGGTNAYAFSGASAATHFSAASAATVRAVAAAAVPTGDFHLDYNHDIIAARDFALVKQNIAEGMANIWKLPALLSDITWVNSVLYKPYETIYPNDTYRIEYAYNYPEGAWLFGTKLPASFVNGAPAPAIKSVAPILRGISR